jgi:hypothetical protein
MPQCYASSLALLSNGSDLKKIDRGYISVCSCNRHCSVDIRLSSANVKRTMCRFPTLPIIVSSVANRCSISQDGSYNETQWLTIEFVSKGVLPVVDMSLRTSSSLCYC